VSRGRLLVLVLLALAGVALPVAGLVLDVADQHRLRARGTPVPVLIEYVPQPQARGGSPAQVLVGYPIGADWTESWAGCVLRCPRSGQRLRGWVDPADPRHFVTDTGLSYRLVPRLAWWLALVVGLLAVASAAVPARLHTRRGNPTPR
jgi:hypothetical protein